MHEHYILLHQVKQLLGIFSFKELLLDSIMIILIIFILLFFQFLCVYIYIYIYMIEQT